MIHHPMGREIISAASALRAKNNKEIEEQPPAEEKPPE